MSISAPEGSVFYASPHPYLVMLADAPFFTIVAVNRAYAALVFQAEGELLGQSYFTFLGHQLKNDNTEIVSLMVSELERIIQSKLSSNYRIEFPYWGNQYAEFFPLVEGKTDVKYLVQTFVKGHDDVVDDRMFMSQNRVALENDFQHPLFNDYPDPVFTLDVHGNFLSANNALLELAECSKEELLQQSFVPFVNPTDLEKAVEHFQGAIKGVPQYFNVNVISTKGTHRTLDIANLPLVINKEVIGVYVIARDITEAIRSREVAKEYNDRIYSILESIIDGFFAVDENWNVTYWNKQAEHILSMKKENILGKNLWDVYQDAISLKFYTEYHRAVSENIAVRFDEYFPPLKLWIEVSAFPSRDGLSVYFKDITFRKEAEALVRSEKEKYLTLFNLSPVPQWVYDVETLQFLDVNDAAIQQYGYSRSEFLNMTLNDIRPDQDVWILQDIVKTKLKKGASNSSIVRHKKKDGKIISVSVDGNSMPFEGKDARMVLAFDITTKLKAEQVLEASERRFRALVQDGSDLIAILDLNGVYKYVSANSRPILGIEPAGFIGKSVFTFIHEADVEFFREGFKMLKTTKRIHMPPFRFDVGGKQYRWIDTIFTNMMDEPGVEGLVANSRDITEAMLDKIRAEESVKRYEMMSEATSDVIWDWDANTDLVTWNRGIKRIFGYDQVEYSYAWWLDRINPEDVLHVTTQIQSLVDKLEPKFEVEYRFRCMDGNYKHVLDRGFIMFDQKGFPYRMTGSMEDITQRKAYTEKIEGQNRRLLDISQLQSHYVRAPLSQIMALVELLKAEQQVAGNEETLTYLSQAAERLDAVIKDIIKNTEDN